MGKATRSSAVWRRLPLLVLSLLSGCITSEGEPPAQFPRPLYDIGCPVISGSYALQLDPDSQGALSEAWFGPQSAEAAVLAIDDDPDRVQWRMTWYHDPAEFERELDVFRQSEPARHATWLREARLLLDPLSSRYQRDRSQVIRELAKLGPTPEWRYDGHKWQCEDGWYVTWQGDKAVRLNVDVENGLLIQLDQETRNEITVWCGDGCKGIPYYLHVRSRWMRLSPVARPAAWYPPEVPFAVGDSGVTDYNDRDVRVTELRERLQAKLSGHLELISLEQWSDHVALSIFIDGMHRLPLIIDWLQAQAEIAEVTQSSRMSMSDGRVRIVLDIRFKR